VFRLNVADHETTDFNQLRLEHVQARGIKLVAHLLDAIVQKLVRAAGVTGLIQGTLHLIGLTLDLNLGLL